MGTAVLDGNGRFDLLFMGWETAVPQTAHREYQLLAGVLDSLLAETAVCSN